MLFKYFKLRVTYSNVKPYSWKRFLCERLIDEHRYFIKLPIVNVDMHLNVRLLFLMCVKLYFLMTFAHCNCIGGHAHLGTNRFELTDV